MEFNIVVDSQLNRSVTVWLSSGQMLTANEAHPDFEAICDACRLGDEVLVKSLFDIEDTVRRSFNAVSSRVDIHDGQVLFDGKVIDNSLTQTVLRFRQRRESFRPLVAFFERIMDHMDDHVREQLFDWIRDRHLTITDDGRFIAYKGTRPHTVDTGETVYYSIHAGPAMVDGVAVNGHVPNQPGSVVEIERSYVDNRSDVGCSTGLHAGTWDYAANFANGAVLTTIIDPRDVISVPTDCSAQKLRVCRYEVNAVTEQQSDAVLFGDELSDDEALAIDEVLLLPDWIHQVLAEHGLTVLGDLREVTYLELQAMNLGPTAITILAREFAAFNLENSWTDQALR